MNSTWIAFASLTVLLATGPGVQDKPSEAGPTRGKNRLTRVAPDSRDDDEDGPFDREAWKKKLTQADLAARQDEFERLAGIARGNDAARAALEDWSHDTQNQDLAWTSRLLLREIQRAPRAGRRKLDFEADAFGRDFDTDRFQRWFEDLDSNFNDLRRDFDDMLRSPPAGSKAQGGVQGHESAQSFTLQVGPDGVTCEVLENVDGKQEKRKYEAQSLDELLEAHPELRDRIRVGQVQGFGLGQGLGAGPQFRTWTWPGVGSGSGRLLRVPPQSESRPEGDAGTDSALRTDRLGVHCTPTPEDKAQELSIDAGQGLLVTDVVDGSLAELLAIRTGDVIVEVAGRKVKSSEDVHAALAARAPDSALSVVVVDAKGSRRTLTWTPKVKAAKEKRVKAEGRDF
jgi:hypothetical protein